MQLNIKKVLPPKSLIKGVIPTINKIKNEDIVFVGAQVNHKGLNDFIKYVYSEPKNSSRKFTLISSTDMLSVSTKFLEESKINLIIFDPIKEELVEVFRKIGPRYIWLVRRCYETFSLVLHDALECGIIPITNKDSGNIYYFCTENKIPYVEFPELNFDKKQTGFAYTFIKTTPAAGYFNDVRVK
jgi:hypothetical protein